MFRSLLHKHFLLVMGHWRLTLTMIILPVALFSGVIYGRWKTDSFKKTDIPTATSYKSHHQNFLLTQLPGKFKLLHAPLYPLANKIIAVVQEKFQVPQEDIRGFNSEQQLLKYYERNQEEIPIVAIMFSCEDSNRLVYNLTISDKSLNWRPNKLFIREDDASFGTSNYVNLGFSALQLVIDFAFIEAIKNQELNATISLQRFPYPPHNETSESERFFMDLLPLTTILSFLVIYPTILCGIVDEKSSGIKELLKLSGVKSGTMWMAWIFEAFVTNIFSITTISVLMKMLPNPLIEHSNGPMLFVLLFLYFAASLSFSFFVSTFFNGRGLGTTVGIIISITSYLIPKAVIENLELYGYNLSQLCKICMGVLPNISLYYGYSTISAYEEKEVGIQWTNWLRPGNDGGLSIGEVYFTLLGSTIIFMLGTIYMDIVNPGKYGIGQPLYFPITSLLKFFEKENNSADVEAGLLQDEENVAIKVVNLCKSYGLKQAIYDLSFDIKKNSITLLIGRNGAGKSTTMSIITGIIKATSGFVQINGKNITNNLDEIRRNIGLCTQNNLLFNDLTVEEHLEFFGQLKGVKDIPSRISVLMDQFELSKKKDALARTLSGGMKRKLCLAIALVANPEILILDEPTSGMDIGSRQKTWDRLIEIRKNTTILMTTHFMEEADTLSDYVVILDNGQLRCFDTPLNLKKEYGTGYQLKLNKSEFASPQQVDNLKIVVAQVNGTLARQDNLNIIVNLPVENKQIFSQVFRKLEEQNIGDMDLSLVTLNDVFLKVQGKLRQQLNFAGFNYGQHFTPTPNVLKGIVALCLKRYFFLKRSYLRYSPRLLIAMVMFLTTMFSFQIINQTSAIFQEAALNLTLESYGNTEVYFGGPAPPQPQLEKSYEEIVQLHNSNFTISANVSEDIIKKGKENLVYYKENMVASAEVETKDDLISINAMYSSYALHSAPISLNLATNMIAQFLIGENYSISIIHAPLQKTTALSELPVESVVIAWLILVPTGMLILMSNFIIFPFEELSTGFVHIQKTSGLRLIYYWIVNVIFDIVLYTLKTSFVFLSAILIDFTFFNSSNYGLEEYGYLVLVFIVYAWSSLPFTYLFAYDKSLARSCAWYATAGFLLGIMPATIVSLLESTNSIKIAKNLSTVSTVFHLISPQYGLSYRGYHFAKKYVENFNWKFMDEDTKLYSCNIDPNPCCFDEGSSACSNYKSYFREEPIGAILLLSLASGLLYLAILLLLNHVEWFKQYCFRPKKREITEGVILTPVLEAMNIKKRYGRNEVVKGLNIQLKDNICYGLLGVNGSGKTTTFKMLTKNVLPDNGRIRIRKNNMWLSSTKLRYSRQLGYCPQNDALNLRLSGKEVLLSVALLRGYSWKDSLFIASNLLKIFDLERYADLECGNYSGGNKRKLSICVALTGYPRAILLDEPTSGMDPSSQREFWELISSLKKYFSIILCSHSMEECETLCDQIAIIKNGKIEEQGSILEVKNAQGKVYTVTFQLKSASKDDIERFKEELSEFELLENEHQEKISYKFKKEKLSNVFKKAEMVKNESDFVEDYVVFSRSLHDAFISLENDDTSDLLSNAPIRKKRWCRIT